MIWIFLATLLFALAAWLMLERVIRTAPKLRPQLGALRLGAMILAVSLAAIGVFDRTLANAPTFALALTAVAIFVFGRQLLLQAAGLYVVISGAVRIGDHLDVGDVSGEVKEIHLRALDVHQDNGGTARIPMSALATTPFTVRRHWDPHPVVLMLPVHIDEAHDLATLCPYRDVSLPVTVTLKGTECEVRFHAWSADAAEAAGRWVREATR